MEHGFRVYCTYFFAVDDDTEQEFPTYEEAEAYGMRHFGRGNFGIDEFWEM